MTRWFKWTPKMDAFLRQEYPWIGDKHLAELFQVKFPKHYPWTEKHIEKRRSYLNLKRTPEQVSIIRIINNKDGRQYKMWDARNRMKELEVREWNGRKYIKVKGEVMLYNRHISKAKKGQVARSYEGEIRLISRKENQRLNMQLRALMPVELKQTIKVLNKLKKLIYGKENSRPPRNSVRHY